MLVSDVVDINDVVLTITDTYDLEAELQVEKFRSVIKSRNVLTPSHREQASSLPSRDMKSRDMGKWHILSY